ncbi:MAG: M23 family metallopeptidase [Tannerellaceae bacterium]|nr:M23 family metallopeptidase [Tannerellaceae bacterium]
MMLKRLHYIYVFGLIGVLSDCSLVRTSTSGNVSGVSVVYPASDIDLPSAHFAFYLPRIALAELEAPASPLFDITEDFCAFDMNHISVSDPKLFKNDEKMSIDLTRIRKGEYSFPLPGAKVISSYAGRRKNHSGTDLKTFANDTIRAAFDGIVRMAKPYYAYGNVIVLRHFNGLETVYSHNSKHLIKQGEYVKAGEPVALVGRTGRATTEHLHFEVRVNGQHFNPEFLFDMNAQELQSKRLVCTQGKNRIIISSMDTFSNLPFMLNASN